MKVYISCDIEGVATTTMWLETPSQELNGMIAPHKRQMTLEVKAACEGAIAAGADFILVKDSHGSGLNIDITELPECVEVIRGPSAHPHGMAYGVDSSFDAMMFVGYHSAAGKNGNPLSHTLTLAAQKILINGRQVSEFDLYSLLGASLGVPTVFLSGDRALCQASAETHPKLMTVAVKSGEGSHTRSISPSLACKKIKETAESALRQDLSDALREVPERYTLEICYKEQVLATKHQHYPGMRKIDDLTIGMETDRYLDILTAIRYVL